MLVAIGVVGLLAALLLPAVQSSGEAAGRTLCRNNLRRVGSTFIGQRPVDDPQRPDRAWGWVLVGSQCKAFHVMAPRRKRNRFVGFRTACVSRGDHRT